MPKIVNPVVKARRIEKKRTVLLSEVTQLNISLGKINSGITRRGVKRVNSFANRVRQYALNSTGSFTTRQAAEAVLGTSVGFRKSSEAGMALQSLVKSGQVVRFQRNAVDAKNSGQLVYTKAN